jgi:hypothetical protein
VFSVKISYHISVENLKSVNRILSKVKLRTVSGNEKLKGAVLPLINREINHY